jgi:hypothetical protein|tara:strand:+ start:323 stop:517 length:195 start_codon:yes stop_codon:yes gene_type:complete
MQRFVAILWVSLFLFVSLGSLNACNKKEEQATAPEATPGTAVPGEHEETAAEEVEPAELPARYR